MLDTSPALKLDVERGPDWVFIKNHPHRILGTKRRRWPTPFGRSSSKALLTAWCSNWISFRFCEAA